VGTTAMILKMIEDELCPEVSLDNPVQALHEVSWDPTCRQTVKLTDGRRVRPLELQWDYLDHAKKYVKENDATAENAEVVQRWEAVLTGIEEDPLSMHLELDWVAKYRLLTAYRERDGLDWHDPRLAMIALQYHDVRRSKGLYYRLVEAGKVERIVSDQEVYDAVGAPPEDTRAYFRGRCIERYPDAIAAASWDSIIFDTGGDVLQRVPTREPLRGTREHVEALLEESETAGALIARLQASP
jgi:proteasome accessory factor A